MTTATGPALAATRAAGEVVVFEVLPETVIPVTRSFIVATAIASRDYQDVHHDPALAVERGSKDVFLNILTTNGLVERFVVAWAGPAAVVRRIRIRLGAPAYPGDPLVLTGVVEAVDGRLVEVAVRGRNTLGDHVTGTVTLELPDPVGPSPDAGRRS